MAFLFAFQLLKFLLLYSQALRFLSSAMSDLLMCSSKAVFISGTEFLISGIVLVIYRISISLLTFPPVLA